MTGASVSASAGTDEVSLMSFLPGRFLLGAPEPSEQPRAPQSPPAVDDQAGGATAPRALRSAAGSAVRAGRYGLRRRIAAQSPQAGRRRAAPRRSRRSAGIRA